MEGEIAMNVSSIVVTAAKEHLQDVMDTINAMDFCEVHFFDGHGKMVVTIEGASIDEQMERMKKIQNSPSVISANLAYSYCEDEILASFDRIGHEDITC
ncbi:MAG: chaperone NapD [Nitrospiraceae bacterium]|nr:MAG: chaperone NapD [Nitrospiraceae bacterium]